MPGGKFAKQIRYFVCKNLFASCGKNVNVEGGAFFHSGSNLRIGDNSGIGVNADIGGEVTIGNDVMMGPNCVILTRNHKFDRTDIPMNQQNFAEYKAVSIADDVWIGQNVIILPGVQIAKGVVIGAGSVVTRNVSEYDVVAGNPARVLRNRAGERKLEV